MFGFEDDGILTAVKFEMIFGETGIELCTNADPLGSENLLSDDEDDEGSDSSIISSSNEEDIKYRRIYRFIIWTWVNNSVKLFNLIEKPL